MKRSEEKSRFGLRGINSVIAYAASMMLTGVPAVVCESVLEEFCGAVRKSLGKMKA